MSSHCRFRMLSLLICSFVLPACTASPPVEPPIQGTNIRWRDIRSSPAEITVQNMEPVPLIVTKGKKGWLSVPPRFLMHRTEIFVAVGDTNGVAEYEVIESGYALLACNWSNQGNSSGGWGKERWSKEQFMAAGWHPLTEEEVGGKLVTDVFNREQTIFFKKLAKGDKGRLRCNKYDPPFFIICSNEKLDSE